jgi:hypothetical protein
MDCPRKTCTNIYDKPDPVCANLVLQAVLPMLSRENVFFLLQIDQLAVLAQGDYVGGIGCSQPIQEQKQ